MICTERIRAVRSRGHLLDDSADHLGWMRESNDVLSDEQNLRARFHDEGYLLLRGVLEQQAVLDARQSILETLAAEGHLDPSADLMEGILRADARLSFRADLAIHNPRIERVLYQDAMIDLFQRLFDGPVRHFDYTWLRAISPGKATPAHCDIVYMGRGSKRLCTAWTPLGQTPLELGGLMVLEGSHRNQRLRDTYGKLDDDAFCTNRERGVDESMKTDHRTGHLTEDPNQVRRSLGGRWLVQNFSPGDVVIFSVYLVHGGLDNQTPNRLRLSTDSRYQPASDPADERWIGANPPAHGPRAKRGMIC
jgi:hypothetical protein